MEYESPMLMRARMAPLARQYSRYLEDVCRYFNIIVCTGQSQSSSGQVSSRHILERTKVFTQFQQSGWQQTHPRENKSIPIVTVVRSAVDTSQREQKYSHSSSSQVGSRHILERTKVFPEFQQSGRQQTHPRENKSIPIVPVVRSAVDSF